jgi:hypothetical protein
MFGLSDYSAFFAIFPKRCFLMSSGLTSFLLEIVVSRGANFWEGNSSSFYIGVDILVLAFVLVLKGLLSWIIESCKTFEVSTKESERSNLLLSSLGDLLNILFMSSSAPLTPFMGDVGDLSFSALSAILIGDFEKISLLVFLVLRSSP